ncbi:YaaA family protein [Allobranchiibius sp. CTAmp26]|uniref:YaaA family protein n=1 Tax=Allobranchiibius sp. CTAmp26 TaxID=2815214 RepID=UPI001AA1A319|nr:peroxide stress protein YaaA [Allobranchiibius sp. CTAmp26]MBO1754506.1 peroxide stress protein YaaA [Allobranchiibius sp. CTAmp26]
MLVLLPPSESKHGRSRGAALDIDRLSFPALSATRTAVLDALGDVSTRPDAASVLGVSPNLVDDIARNTRLRAAPATPVAQLYTGVLYDALDLASFDPAALRRARRWIVVQSAAFGALRLGDKVPPYRLSMAVNLPGLGPLAGLWRAPLDDQLTAAAGRRLVVDCRSSTYAAAWTPRGPVARRWVRIEVPGATHGAKHTRGLVTRALCELPTEPTTPRALQEALRPTFETELVAPATAARPWSLSVSAR